MSNPIRNLNKSRAPEDSVMFEKIMPVVLIALGILTVVLIGFAAGILLGFIHL
jgi:hypothetical protein